MSNNIYNILGKLNALTPKETPKSAEPKTPIYESVESQGSVLEGVARVEQQLAERYMGFKEAKPHPKELEMDADVRRMQIQQRADKAEKELARRRAEPKNIFQKVKKDIGEPLKKLARGDIRGSLSETDIEESGLQAYLGKKKYGEEGMRALQQAGRDGASKEKMAKIRAKHDKMDEALRGINTDGTDPAHPGERKAIAQQIKAKRAANRADPTMSDTMPGMRKRPQHGQDSGGQHVIYRDERQMAEDFANEDMLSAKQQKIAKMSPPTDKIDANDLKALRAGKNKKEEGNEFSGELAKAKAQHKDSFTVGGKEYPVKEDTHGQWLKKKESEAKQSGKSTFQAFKQTHDVTGKPAKEEQEESLEEGWDDMLKAVKDRAGPQPSGGSGIKQGKRYGGGKQKDDEGDEEVSDQPKKKGRPKKDKFAEVAPPGAKAERMVKHIKKGYAKDGKITPKEKSIAYATAWKAHNKGKLKEGVNFAEMMREANAEADELLTELQMEISEFKKSGHMGDKLRDVLELHKFSKKPVVDEVVMPAMEAPMAESGAFHPGRVVYWRGKAGIVDRVEGDKCFVNKPNGEMDVWPTKECSTEKQGMLDTFKKDVKSIGQGIKGFVTGGPEPMDEELNELAKLAGLSEAKKCNHTMEGKSCPVHGLKECGSGMYEGKKPDFLDLDKDGNKKEPMKKAAKDKVNEDLQADDGEYYNSADDFFSQFEADHFDNEVESDDGMEVRGYIDGVNVMAWRFNDESKTSGYGVYNDDALNECGPGPMSSMGQDEGSLSINTSMNSDGTKSVSVNATGNQADALAQMLKMAGIGGHGHAEEPKAVVVQAGPEEHVEEERDAQYANTPDEEVENVDAIMHQGNDLNREKEQYADKPKSGDNPMATRESIEMPKSISRMLEGVKLASKQ